ncbi:UTP--GlnB (protein PII) uridylyltransferase, GlnD [Methylomagnum ishizawai]|uniref:Bifunctional uridylyltransferase/uridylyl-removing enzyme n=1 Tax=Methylomagnum ishizawai TaxID=1760988 RepID=A0A1Y6DB99_9GAMM|nr:[protein-PII] uridylyltransferase [Methylomagnum ishizawai]SMF96905.1 UTP--GlnB (protein PII) uridylyltransferase, GlnD [Methylomagnum ishizawai]
MSKNVSNQPVPDLPGLIKTYKDRLGRKHAELVDWFRAGTPAAELIRLRSDFLDEILIDGWHHFLGPLAGRLALIAVGGYGRRELHPHSDIDILVLLDTPEPPDPITHRDYQQPLTGFLNFLWDIGLKPAQSVRTVEECLEAAERDQTIITNLTEARLLYGRETLFEALASRLGPDHLWPSKEFFEAKMAEQAGRYAKYHDTAYNLEPNIKEGPGGLRDIQIIGWIIKRHYNSRNLQDLLRQGWLTEAEYTELAQAQDFLWQVRFALHVLTKRCEDRLLFEYQKELARQFGYMDPDINLAVERFMQRYFRTVMGLERLNEMLLQLFKEVCLHRDEDFVFLPINENFQAVNSYVEVLDPGVFRKHPLALLQIFLLLQQNTSLQGIRASTIRLIRQHLYLIDEDFRRNPEACRLFMTILRQKTGITHQLRRMNRYGVLAAYLPPFGRVVGRMQYDLFHVYTVDEHTLFVIRNLRRFSLAQYRADHPLCSELFELIPKPEILYIAALMHDIAKGSGEDHSTLGATIAQEFCLRHGISARDTELIKWLVQHHLIMSMTAQRKDINDPEIIHQFATAVGSQATLDHLYLLTVADIRATNPNLWNSWKDALLKELYLTTRWVFRRGLTKPLEQAEKIAQVKAESRVLLHKLGIPDPIVERVWNTLNDEYFLRYLPEEAAWHTVAISFCGPEDLPLVLLRPVSQRGSAEIFIYAQDQDFIFAHSTAVLEQLGLTIFDAKIITAGGGRVMNSYHILEQTGEPIRDQMRQVQICAKLRECLKRPGDAPIQVQRRESRQIKHFTVPTQLYFHEDPQDRYTILELVATDRPGLLSKVGRAFTRCGIRLYNAKISTIGSRAEDIFYITDAEDRPLRQESQRQILRDCIVALVGSH